MLLHCGGKEVEFADVELVDTPESTTTHHPIPHSDFVRSVERHLDRGGFEIGETQHALAKDGLRYFGVMNLNVQGLAGDYNWSIALRNSHDKTYPAGLAAGSHVLVCDNLCFSGEVTVMRKHTSRILKDLDNRVTQAIGQLGGMLTVNDNRYGRYKEKSLRDPEVNDIMIRALDAQIIPSSRISKVLENWREPRQEVWKEHRNVWGLFNAFTEDFKHINDPSTFLKRGRALHGLMDTIVGFDVSRN